MCAAAVDHGVHATLASRVREVNGEFPKTEKDEMIKFSTLKDHGQCLNSDDMAAFVSWFTQESLEQVNSYEKIKAQLSFLKHQRLARLHVFSNNSPIPPSLSMSC
jgi:hypothetical protein